MSPLPMMVVLDNTVISSLHLAGALDQVLRLWPGRWIVPLQVRDEIALWKVHGAAAVRLLEAHERHGVLQLRSPDPGPEAALFIQLQRTRGQGESAAIAIAYNCKGSVATDDRRARRSAERLSPPVAVLATERLLSLAVEEGLLTIEDAEAIWAGTGIQDPNRGIGK